MIDNDPKETESRLLSLSHEYLCHRLRNNVLDGGLSYHDVDDYCDVRGAASMNGENDYGEDDCVMLLHWLYDCYCWRRQKHDVEKLPFH
jgi:hypothetical protein